MGLYLNPGNDFFARIVKNDTYVDKTGLISYMNGQIGKAKHLIASSRPRRFGKTLAAQMLAAYYSKGCNSYDIFRNLEIAKDESFEKHLNKYDVIKLDIQWMRGVAIRKIQRGENLTVLGYIEDEVLRELHQEFPEYVSEQENSLAAALADINVATKKQFVIIIDEWDCIFREDKENKELQKDYINFLRGLFKGDASDAFVKLAYITGILPIKKYGTQSALNNFRELTMISPGGIAEYVGFTETEVKELCRQNRASFAKMQKWYDGYIFDQTDDLGDDGDFVDDDFSSDADDFAGDDFRADTGVSVNNNRVIMHIYSPNSVMEALSNRKFQNYWTQTETYESLKMYIEMDFDGLKQKVVDMLGGGRCGIAPEVFQNDMTSFKSASDVLTLLVHLGYLAYDSTTREVFIPNEEICDTFVLSVMDDGWADVYAAALKEYKGNMLLVGINYDKKTKKHQCKIEKY